MSKVIRAILATNNSWTRLASLALAAALYGIANLHPYHPRDAVWAFIVCAAFLWGLVELWRNERRCRVTADPRSQLKLS